ncbi:hypothetical protein VNO77_19244 [Canavalia gladiata]|uniref:Uncharacterized protein n=1 Tax=Canavalia gladiata TaxID=3824 RepID=A0AAN9LMD3_CANGL
MNHSGCTSHSDLGVWIPGLKLSTKTSCGEGKVARLKHQDHVNPSLMATQDYSSNHAEIGDHSDSVCLSTRFRGSLLLGSSLWRFTRAAPDQEPPVLSSPSLSAVASPDDEISSLSWLKISSLSPFLGA